MTQLDRIRSKLQAKDLVLNDPATESYVAAFEARHGVELPSGFRAFLTQIGNGGPGPPYYDLVPLGVSASVKHDYERDIWTELPEVRSNFPFTRYWVWENGDTSDQGTLEQITHGNIQLGHDGCGAYWHLVVTGPDRGIPWMFCGEGIQPVCPKRDFLQWYEDWLDGHDSFYGFDYSQA